MLHIMKFYVELGKEVYFEYDLVRSFKIKVVNNKNPYGKPTGSPTSLSSLILANRRSVGKYDCRGETYMSVGRCTCPTIL